MATYTNIICLTRINELCKVDQGSGGAPGRGMSQDYRKKRLKK